MKRSFSRVHFKKNTFTRILASLQTGSLFFFFFSSNFEDAVLDFSRVSRKSQVCYNCSSANNVVLLFCFQDVLIIIGFQKFDCYVFYMVLLMFILLSGSLSFLFMWVHNFHQIYMISGHNFFK